ncbi:hypothetical protein GCM10017674_25920 [Streptomyces gardneri]|uniref:Uncharacterized protein n=1 Tax=Streptomyces gardneri TaxID=66892 RepID=A0A4Y3RSN7_9ACTN|nr:hypothetical protein SGA01_59640 [Streptomyces gardneri]GHG94930.1 hypothetical protein GCM10017674_25920 [Streptomyces gardneri]
MTAAPTSEYPVTAHCSVASEEPVSSLMAGRRMLTADVLAFTTKAETQVAVRTPVEARAAAAGDPPPARALNSRLPHR